VGGEAGPQNQGSRSVVNGQPNLGHALGTTAIGLGLLILVGFPLMFTLTLIALAHKAIVAANQRLR
jgi:cell division protein FtsW (lipid II flippase)